MKNTLLLLLFVLLCPPALSFAAELRTLEVEFAFTAPDDPNLQLTGYRLYKETSQVCVTTDPGATALTCELLTEDGTFNFTLAAYYANGTESPHSPSFPFTISSTTTTYPIGSAPPPSTGSKTINYSWDTNSSADNVAGYRMYMNDSLLCQTDAVSATTLSCNADLLTVSMAFTVASYDTGGTESLRSNILLLDPSTLPEPTPTTETLQAVINPTPASGEVPLKVSFTATDSTGDIASYTWDFGDGGTGTGSVAEHSYSVSGTYTATLHITDKNGATSQVSTSISALPSTVVITPPTAVLSSSTAVGDAPLLVTFNGTGSTTSNPPIVSYSWAFGDGSQATGATTSHSFTTAGTYYTTLTVTDSKGLTDTIDTPVIVTSTVLPNENPTAVITANPPSGDAPITISFDGSKSSDTDGSISDYSWNFGDGTTGSGPTTQHTYTNAGSYIVSLQVTDDKGATATATTQIACNTTEPALNINIEVGEVSLDHTWSRVVFSKSFNQPIVVAGPPTTNDSEPVLVRIRNIDQEGFDIRLQEWDYQDGSHAQETFSYIVLEKGIYTLDNGSKIEAGSFTGTSKFGKVTLQQAYNLTPVILTQVQTENEADAVTGRLRKISQSSFDYMLQEQETTNTSHTNETVGYIAWEPGQGSLGNLLYDAGKTANSVTQDWSELSFLTDFPDMPMFIAGMQSYDGGDSAALRSQNMSQTTVQVKIEEEQSKDSEVAHTTEVVGYLAIGSATKATEPQTTNPAEKKFTFTWEYGDTQNVSGFRFYLNNSLLSETTNPDDRQITCYSELLNETMVFTMTAVFLDGSEGEPSNVLSLDPADYPELFGIRLVTFSWDYDASLESSISGFRIYNNAQLVCETADPTARQISCETATQDKVNNFSIVAVDISGTETSPSNEIQYNP
jgi:PKD repeat protein